MNDGVGGGAEGLIEGTVSNGGIFTVSASMKIMGTYTHLATGTLRMWVVEAVQSQLMVTGAISFQGGTLDVTVQGPFSQPEYTSAALGWSESDSISGSFDTVLANGLPAVFYTYEYLDWTYFGIDW